MREGRRAGLARAVAADPGRRSDLHKLHTKEKRPPGWWRALALRCVWSHGYMRQTPRTWQTRMRLCDGSMQKVNASQCTLSAPVTAWAAMAAVR